MTDTFIYIVSGALVVGGVVLYVIVRALERRSDR